MPSYASVFSRDGGYFDPERLGQEIAVCEQQMAEPDFWDDQNRAREISQQCAHKKTLLHDWDSLKGDSEVLYDLATQTEAHDEVSFRKDFDELQKRFIELERVLLFTEEYDDRSCLLAIHAGTGGVDAMDWAQILLRMYGRFCEQMHWKVTILDEQQGAEAGIKSVLLSVEGFYAYGYLKAEHGVHRLVRISPFDAEGLRHTSFALVEALPDIGEGKDVVIKSDDIRIDVFRASGKGGQGVNTTDSAVRITHIPTGIVVQCQNERSQLQNKESAMRYLAAKLHQKSQEALSAEKKKLRGEYSEAAWGNQIRSYVLNPYKMVKDHRTDVETQEVQDVLDGDLMPFIDAHLRYIKEHGNV